MELFIEHGLQPEIGLEGDVLYTRSREDFQRLAATLQRHNLSCTLHAPFFDLAPGGLDPKIRQVSREKLALAFELIPIFKPRQVICHLNYEDDKHRFKQEQWFTHARQTWQELLTVAQTHQTPLLLENTYEKNPEQHLRMLHELDSPLAGFCFDTGHVLAFSGNTWQDWLPPMLPWLKHLHLHDNKGGLDSHLAVGQGCFDFQGVFDYLSQQGVSPTVTLEPHKPEDLWVSLEALREMGVLGV